MITEKGLKTGLDISPVAQRIEIVSSVVDGVVDSKGISFANLTNYIVQDGKRVAITDDKIEAQADRILFVSQDTIGEERATQLNNLLVAIFEENFIKKEEVNEG